MSNVHLYTAPVQPATCFVDRTDSPPMKFRFAPHATLFTNCCRTRRWAKHLQVRVYYDHFSLTCAPGHGCKRGKS